MEKSTIPDDLTWGADLKGRGVLNTFDMMVGLSMILLSLAAVAVDALNLYAIKKLTIFHNAFGIFWVSRTIAEIGYNLGHVVYSGPITAFQPKDIPPSLGIADFFIGYYFAAVSCTMNQCVSVNRLVAVCFPLKYNFIFTNKIAGIVIMLAWLLVAALISLYFGR
ncbi:hypothetical protein QR680_015854 [Steinernema hermaphroditum]|uniref:G-protein coupled receptors family 1 profile domain-containing protein n=1 Tax=Steinernema hermaphroditum TaxID=289476 RepID=A0AA39HBQ9_9BILA|nr:hypothetical protein QR680_015854 [Steinernema hermaphroditum]